MTAVSYPALFVNKQMILRASVFVAKDITEADPVHPLEPVPAAVAELQVQRAAAAFASIPHEKVKLMERGSLPLEQTILSNFSGAVNSTKADEMFDPVPDDQLLDSFNAKTAAELEAFQYCQKMVAESGRGKWDLRSHFIVGQVPAGADEKAAELVKTHLSKFEGLSKETAIAHLRGMFAASWPIAMNSIPMQLRVPQIGDKFDDNWMERHSICAREKGDLVVAVWSPCLVSFEVIGKRAIVVTADWVPVQKPRVVETKPPHAEKSRVETSKPNHTEKFRVVETKPAHAEKSRVVESKPAQAENPRVETSKPNHAEKFRVVETKPAHAENPRVVVAAAAPAIVGPARPLQLPLGANVNLSYAGFTTRAECGWPSEAQVANSYVKLLTDFSSVILNSARYTGSEEKQYFQFCHSINMELRTLYAKFYKQYYHYYPDAEADDAKKKEFLNLHGKPTTEFHQLERNTKDIVWSSIKSCRKKFPLLPERDITSLLCQFGALFRVMFCFPPIICLRFVDSDWPFNSDVMIVPPGERSIGTVKYTLRPGLVTAGRCLVKALVLTSIPTRPVADLVKLLAATPPQINAEPNQMAVPAAVLYSPQLSLFSAVPSRVCTKQFGGLFPEHMYQHPMIPIRQKVVILEAGPDGRELLNPDLCAKYYALLHGVHNNAKVFLLGLANEAFDYETGLNWRKNHAGMATGLARQKRNSDDMYSEPDISFCDYNVVRNFTVWKRLALFVTDPNPLVDFDAEVKAIISAAAAAAAASPKK